MPGRVLVTGAAGFLGRHLCSYLQTTNPGLHLAGTDAMAGAAGPCREFHVVDLTDAEAVARLVHEVSPDCVIHLAGTFGTGQPLDIYRVNVLSIVALLEAVRRHVPRATVVATGSAAEYGRVPPECLPVTETCACVPVTPYGQSKLAATQIALLYHRMHSLAVVVVRPFQLLGPGVTTRLAPGAFAEQLRQALAEGRRVIQVGNLESQRDFLDVHDAAAGVWALCRRPAPGEVFNLCSGRPTRMAELLQTMIRVSGADVQVEIDPGRLRGAADVAAVYGSFEKLRRHCGWEPRCGLEESVRAMLA